MDYLCCCCLYSCTPVPFTFSPSIHNKDEFSPKIWRQLLKLPWNKVLATVCDLTSLFAFKIQFIQIQLRQQARRDGERRNIDGEWQAKSVQERQITCTIYVCFHQNSSFCVVENRITYNFNYFLRLWIEFNWANACFCLGKASFAELWSDVPCWQPERWCLKPLMPMNLNKISLEFSHENPLEAFLNSMKWKHVSFSHRREIRRNGNS